MLQDGLAFFKTNYGSLKVQKLIKCQMEYFKIVLDNCTEFINPKSKNKAVGSISEVHRCFQSKQQDGRYTIISLSLSLMFDAMLWQSLQLLLFQNNQLAFSACLHHPGLHSKSPCVVLQSSRRGSAVVWPDHPVNRMSTSQNTLPRRVQREDTHTPFS